MIRLLLVSVCLAAACGGGSNNLAPKYQCADGKDNDGDGKIDFPDDEGCTSAEDNSEDSAPAAQCSDGRDNDGDGKVDFPEDPGCYAPQQDDERDDCPDGPGCPECSNGKDDDGNGQTDYPNDTGCTAASDTDEYTDNPAACGSNVHIQKLPFDGHKMGTLMAGHASNLMSPMCGGAGVEDVYELRIRVPKVIVATTNSDLTTADTVLYIRPADCMNAAGEMACNDDSVMGIKSSTLTQAISTPGTYYLVVDAKDANGGGDYDLQVKFFVGEGTACQGQDDCGPGLVCRVPVGGMGKVCSKHVCSDGVDDDGDGKNDYPNDPGCTAPDDDDELDTCPNGAGCPECGDGRDDDGDGKTDFPMDTQCQSASSTSEACAVHESVPEITTAMTMGDTSVATDDVKPACALSSSTAPDLTYRLDLPQLSTLNINLDATWDSVTALYNSTCGGTAVSCSDPTDMTVTNVAAGTYYFVVDGWSTGSGPFTINVSGTIPGGISCESPLAQSGALTCATGYQCKGTMGSRTCQPATCGDGIDNDGDGKVDYPNDPGCDSIADDSEADPATAPVCANHADDDADGQSDWPNDYGCVAANGTSEAFCTGETDATAKITAKTTTGTTAGKANDMQPTACSLSSSSNAPEVTYALQIPVQLTTLQIDTIGSSFDTMIYVRNPQCTSPDIACDDDGAPSNHLSLLTMNNVAPGGYSIVVDGYSTNSGAFTLNVHGTAGLGTRCDSPLFSGGANAVLSCPSGTTCTGTPARCQ